MRQHHQAVSQPQDQGQAKPARIKYIKNAKSRQALYRRPRHHRHTGEPLAAHNGIFDLRGSLRNNCAECQNDGHPYQQDHRETRPYKQAPKPVQEPGPLNRSGCSYIIHRYIPGN